MLSPENTYQFLWLFTAVPISLAVWLAVRWKNKTVQKLGDQKFVRKLFAAYSPQKFLLKAILPLIAIVFFSQTGYNCAPLVAS